MKKTVIILLLFFMAQMTWAVKAQRGPSKIKQKDGTTLTIRSWGDAHFHYSTTMDGVLLYHEGYDYFIAKVENDGTLTNTGILAHNQDQRTDVEKAAIAQQDREKFFLQEEEQQKQRVRRREPVVVDNSYFSHSGSPKALVILAEFQDVTFLDSDAKNVFNEYLNADGRPSSTVGNASNGTVSRNHGSVGRYFKDVSFGAFTPQFDVYGPVKLPQNLKYYGAGDDYMDRFIPKVCELADEQVDFSQYDSNNDGRVDILCVIFAGYSEATDGNSSDCIWPKESIITGVNRDGKQIYRYMVSAERNATPDNPGYINGVGVFCHEFSHCMGLPDFYPTSTAAQNAANPGMEYWDLMDGGEYVRNGWNPTEYTAWEREAMGWMTIDTLKDAGTVTMAALSAGGKAYRIMNDNDASGHEYIIIENVQKTGWNERLLSSGMMITHVDYNETAFKLPENRPNNEIGHSRYTIIPADGEYLSSYNIYDPDPDNPNDKVPEGKYTTETYEASMAKDLYPGPGNVTSISSFTMYTGTMNKPFLNIKEENGIVTFDFLKATGIKGVKEQTVEDNKIYALDGTFMGTDRSTLKKGVYVINRKKVVIK